MTERVAEGECPSAAVKLRAYGQPDAGVIYCHCRKSSGVPVSLFAGYGSEQVETEQGTPKVYKLSPRVRRSFCADCGTSLLYEDERLSGEVYLMLGHLPRSGAVRAGGARLDFPEAGVARYSGRFAP